jgi:hypothetical protein
MSNPYQNDELKSFLNSMQDVWSAPVEVEFPEFPDGTYRFKLQDGEMRKGRTSGNWHLHVEHLCLDGDMTGSVFHQYIVLRGDKRDADRLKLFFAGFGYPLPTRAADIEGTVQEMVTDSPVYIASIKDRNGFKNFRLEEITNGREPITLQDLQAGKSGNSGPKSMGKASFFQKGDRVEATFEDGVMGGECQAIRSDEAEVVFDDGQLMVVSMDQLRPEADMNRNTAFLVATVFGIEVAKEDPTDKIIEKLKEKEWKAEELTDSELELFKRLKIDVVATPMVTAKRRRVKKK